MMQVRALVLALLAPLSLALVDRASDCSSPVDIRMLARVTCFLVSFFFHFIMPSKANHSNAAVWLPPPIDHLELETPSCNIPFLNETQWEAYKGDGPVVLVGVTNNSHFSDVTEKANLLARFGETEIVLSSANTHSYKKTRKTLAKYLSENMAPRVLADRGDTSYYHFGDNKVGKRWHGI